MLRYLSYKIANCELSSIIKNTLKETSITNKYQEIDSYLFAVAYKNKVTN